MIKTNAIRKKITSIIMILLLIMPMLLTGTIDSFSESENYFPFFTDVSITDENGNDFSGTVSKDTEITLRYDFEVPNNTTGSVFEVTYNFEIPNEIDIISDLRIPLTNDDDEVLGEAHIFTDNTGTIILNDFAAGLSNVKGWFWIYSKFDEAEIIDGGDKDIVFDLGTSNSKVITIPFEKEDEKSNIKLAKSGSYNPQKNEITWKIAVTPETSPNNRELTDVLIKDYIEDSQTYIVDSATIIPEVEGDFSYDDVEKVLSFSFAEAINKASNEEYTITFKTKPEELEFTANNQVKSFINTASADYKDGSVEQPTTFSNQAKVDITSKFIEKNGKIIGNDSIEWTVQINNNYSSITNAKIEDTLPANSTNPKGTITLDEESIKLNGIPISIDNINGPLKYDEINRKLTYEFTSEINTPQTLTYRTKYDVDGTVTFTNIAKLTGNEVPDNIKISKGVQVTQDLLEKGGGGYFPSTQEVGWQIRVNKNKAPMVGATVTDEIPAGLEYVEGSVVVWVDGLKQEILPPGLSFEKPPAGKNGRGILKYELGDFANEKYVRIDFKTKVLDNELYSKNKTSSFGNQVYLELPGKLINAYAGQQFVSKVISKESLGYNYNTREIEWKVTINQNKMPLTNVVVTDMIPSGHKYVEGSSAIGVDSINPSYDETYNTLTYSVGDITDEKVIKFKTIVDDKSIFEDNKTIEVVNKARISANEISGFEEATANRLINNTLISKKGFYETGQNYIDWQVTLNQNSLEIETPILEDTLQEGLSLDRETVTLYKADRADNGTLTKGEKIDISSENINYNNETRFFEFKFNHSISSPYILEFRTDIDDNYRNSDFKNTIYLKGTKSTQEANSGSVSVIFQIGGGGASGNLGSVTIEKVDSLNRNIRLEGAKFQLQDSMGNILDEKNTDLNGKVVFDKLKFRTYTIKEILAPQGYLLSDIPYTFDISSTNKDIHLTVENTLEDKEAVTPVDPGQPENPVTPETPNPKEPDSERPISNKPDEREPQENIDTPNAPLGIPNLENPEENINTPNAPLGAPTVETPEENIGTEGNPLGAPTLPKTGGIDSIWFYIVASVFITAGVMIRIKYKL